jgi:hypothetical protein
MEEKKKKIYNKNNQTVMTSIIETVTLEMINETSTWIPYTEITTQSHGM